MKRELVLAGKAVGGASLTGAVLYLVGTAPTHIHVYWPYCIFLGGLVAGIALYYAGQERTVSTDRVVAPESDEVPELTGPAVTDHWQSNLNGVGSEMLLLQNNLMSHPGYSLRPPTDIPPSVRIGLQVACAQLDPAASSSELRAKILRFLGQSAVMDLVRELTNIPRGAVWTARDDTHRSTSVLSSRYRAVTKHRSPGHGSCCRRRSLGCMVATPGPLIWCSTSSRAPPLELLPMPPVLPVGTSA